MSEKIQERRQYQRFDLEPPIAARLGPVEVLMVDIGLLGAMVEHDAVLQVSQKGRLELSSDGRPLEFKCEVVYTSASPLLDPNHPQRGHRKRHSGIRFDEAVGESDRLLRELITQQARRSLGTEDVANMVPSKIEAGPYGRDAATIGFSAYRLIRTSWRKTATDQSKQPEDGFTVPANEDEDHIQLLCRTYEKAAEEGRRAVRAIAEMSVGQAQGLPKKAL